MSIPTEKDAAKRQADDGSPKQRDAVVASLRRAIRLTAPAATGAFTAAIIALDSADVGRLAFGVAMGAILGAGVAGLTVLRRQDDTPSPPQSLNRLEQLGERASKAAALIGGPTASMAEAVSDARLILERLPAALLLLDAKGRIMFSNSAADAEIGRCSVGEHFSSALRAPALAEAVREAYEGRPLVEIDFTQRRFQERHVHAIVRGLTPSPQEEQEGEAEAAPGALERRILGQARVAVMLQDQTRIRRAEQLHRDFVANASHELKTPIASITGFVETLRGPAKDDAEAHERFLRIMAQQAERMRRLVEDLMSLNRIELNEHIPPRETLDVIALLQRVMVQTPQLESAEIEHTLAEYQGARDVRGDAAQLEQVFVNLLENALKYGGGRAPVRIEVAERSAPRRQIGVTVADFGPGIAKEHVRRLTERFYRVDEQPGQLKSGTGLGLSIVKHAVSRHRGELEIDSRLGHGSRFTVWLPRAEDFEGAVAALS